jgi:hypothetical protein
MEKAPVDLFKNINKRLLPGMYSIKNSPEIPTPGIIDSAVLLVIIL